VAPYDPRPLRSGLAVYLRDSEDRGAHEAGLRLAAAHRPPDTRSPRPEPELAGSRGGAQSAAGAGLWAHGPLARHRLVHASAWSAGSTSSRAHPALTCATRVRRLTGCRGRSRPRWSAAAAIEGDRAVSHREGVRAAPSGRCGPLRAGRPSADGDPSPALWTRPPRSALPAPRARPPSRR